MDADASRIAAGRRETGRSTFVGGTSLRPIRLLIVDDSIVVRTVMTKLFADRAEFEVVAAARNVNHALDQLDRTSVDIILLDVEMPGIDGLTALPDIIARSNGARILIVSSLAASGAAATVRALTLGAADTLLKPGAGHFGVRFADQLAQKLLRIGHAPRFGQPRARRAGDAGPADLPALRPQRRGAIECIAIGASTGGIHALSAFFQALAHSVDAPILITQHLPPVFMTYFAGQLHDITGRRATTAEEGMALRRGELIIAPGEAHIRLIQSASGVRIRLDRNPQPSGCTPSVDPMLESVAEIYGISGVGVVLSGMGRDGAIGAAKLAEIGGEVLVQDAESSVVWGMPGAIAKAGNAAMIAAAPALAQRLLQRSEGR